MRKRGSRWQANRIEDLGDDGLLGDRGNEPKPSAALRTLERID